MPDLPTIPALTPSSIPAQDAISFPDLWTTSISITMPDPNGKKVANLSAANYNSALKVLSPQPQDKVTVSSPDLDADAVKYPVIGDVMMRLCAALVNYIPAKHYAAQLVIAQAQVTAAQSTVAQTQARLADMQARLGRQMALPDGPAKTEVLPDTQTQIATLTALVVTQQQAITAAQATVTEITTKLAAVELSLGATP